MNCFNHLLEYVNTAKKVCARNVPLIWDTESHARIIEKKWKCLTNINLVCGRFISLCSLELSCS